MTTFISNDGHWRVSVISRDGTQLMRIEHDSPLVAARAAGRRQRGPEQTAAGWWLAACVRTPADVAAYVPLEELTEVTPALLSHAPE